MISSKKLNFSEIGTIHYKKQKKFYDENTDFGGYL